jgi:hypothetical protein
MAKLKNIDNLTPGPAKHVNWPNVGDEHLASECPSDCPIGEAVGRIEATTGIKFKL